MGRGICYYDVLGLSRNADDVDIKKAFRRLSLKYHPDSNTEEESKAEFSRICEAYDVLSNAKTKGTYDLYGEEVLKSTIDSGGGGYSFDITKGPQAVFARFFGTPNPYEALNALSAQFEKLTTQVKPQPGKSQEYDLLVSLEELYKGCVKLVNHNRRCVDESGNVTIEQRSLAVDIKPGLLDGTRFVFQGEGDTAPGVPPGPVVLVLSAAAHPRFKRHLGDLTTTVQLPLMQALTGGAVAVTTLDDRVLSVALEEIVTPGLVMRVSEEGLPLPGGGKGDLLLQFELLFPTCLSQQQKMLLRAGLLLPAKPDLVQGKALRAFEAAFKDNSCHGWSTGVAKEDGGSQP